MQPAFPATLDRQAIEAPLQAAIGRPVTIVDWQAAPLSYRNDTRSPTHLGVFRVSGNAGAEGESLAWSLILKGARTPAGVVMPDGRPIPAEFAEQPELFGYWRREALLFESRLLDDLPGGIAVPRCYGIVHGEDEIWLWQEDLADSPAVDWPLARYALAARHLGAFNGAYLNGRPLPGEPWLSRHWLRGWLEIPCAMMLGFVAQPDLWGHSAVRAAVPNDTLERILRLWHGREARLLLLERAPRTFCHLDAFGGNLFARDDGPEPRTVLIDWAAAGLAAAGEELASPIVANLLLGQMPLARAAELESAVTEGYLDGLREAGWRGDPRQILATASTAAALRYFLPAATELLEAALLPAEEALARFGHPAGDVIAERAQLLEWLLGMAASPD